MALKITYTYSSHNNFIEQSLHSHWQVLRYIKGKHEWPLLSGRMWCKGGGGETGTHCIINSMSHCAENGLGQKTGPMDSAGPWGQVFLN